MSREQVSAKKKYLDQTFGFNDEPILDQIKTATQLEQVGRMQISPHEGRLLYFLVQLSQARKVVEIGTLYSYSAFHIVKALPSGGKLWTLDQNKKRHQTAKEIFKDSDLSQKIEWLSGPALESLKSLESSAPFDMVFIDADKGSYLKYLDWAETHLKTGGLLVADNTFLFGAVYGEPERDNENVEVMKEFNHRLAKSPLWTAALIPTEEGLTVGIKNKPFNKNL